MFILIIYIFFSTGPNLTNYKYLYSHKQPLYIGYIITSEIFFHMFSHSKPNFRFYINIEYIVLPLQKHNQRNK